MRTAVLICVLSMLAPAAGAAGKTRTLKMHFEQARVVEVVKWFSQKTGKNFIVSDGSQERLTILSSSQVEESQAWEALRLALRDKELRLVDEGSFYRIVHQRRRSPREGQRVERRQERAVTLSSPGKALPDLSEQARLVPAMERGKQVGIKVFGIATGSPYERLGLRNGDVLQRIAGKHLQRPEQLVEALGHPGDGSALKVDLLRRGQPITQIWHIR